MIEINDLKRMIVSNKERYDLKCNYIMCILLWGLKIKENIKMC